MKIEGPGKCLRVYVGANDQWRGTTLYIALVQEARRFGLAGATVVRGVMGYGAHGVVHEPHLLRPIGDLPVVVEFVDTGEKISGFLARLDLMMREGLITLSDVESVRYAKSQPGAHSDGHDTADIPGG